MNVVRAVAEMADELQQWSTCRLNKPVPTLCYNIADL